MIKSSNVAPKHIKNVSYLHNNFNYNCVWGNKLTDSKASKRRVTIGNFYLICSQLAVAAAVVLRLMKSSRMINIWKNLRTKTAAIVSESYIRFEAMLISAVI